MHHILRLYSNHQELVLRLYIFSVQLTRLPVIGKLIVLFGNWFAATQHNAWVLTLSEANEVIDASTSLALGECICRKVFNKCKAPIRTDIVIGIGYDVLTEIKRNEYEEISKEEAKKIIAECSRLGLIQSLVKCMGEVYAVCNCCPCCCVPMRVRKVYGIKNSWVRDSGIIKELIR